MTLVDNLSGGTGITTLPSVLMERDASEVRRGRPAVALDLVQVRNGLCSRNNPSYCYSLSFPQNMILKHLEV